MPDLVRDRGQRLPDQLGTVRGGFVGQQGCALLPGEGTQQGGLAARSGAEVQPFFAALGSGLSVRTLRTRGMQIPGIQVHGSHGAGNQLRAHVLHPGAAFTHRRQPAEVPAAGERRAFHEFTGRGPALQGFVQAPQSGQRNKVHYRRSVVSFKEFVDFGDRASVRHQRLPQGADNPLRVGVADGGHPRFVLLVAEQQLQPLVQRVGGDLAQDGVDQG
ncbi:hypothetical protein D9M72_484050 [compost metagenome]